MVRETWLTNPFVKHLGTLTLMFFAHVACSGNLDQDQSHVSINKNKNEELSADLPNDQKWAGPYSQQYFPNFRTPTGDVYNAQAVCRFPGKKDIAVVQQGSTQSEAIKRALAICSVRCSDTGYGGCTIAKQFVAKLLPRVNGQPSQGYVCRMVENKPLADPVRNRAWPGPPGKSVSEAMKKGQAYTDKKAGIEVQPAKCINNDFDKSDTLVGGDNQSAN